MLLLGDLVFFGVKAVVNVNIEVSVVCFAVKGRLPMKERGSKIYIRV
jgi:hypothetical protein